MRCGYDVFRELICMYLFLLSQTGSLNNTFTVGKTTLTLGI